MKRVISNVCALLIGLSCLCWIFSSEERVYASEKAKWRDMTPEELKTFEPGFGCESQCETGGLICYEDIMCCSLSVINDCEKDVQFEMCTTSGCGFWPWDPCNTVCVEDPPEGCGRLEFHYCDPGDCLGELRFGGAKSFAYSDTNCEPAAQCHTGSI